ncbi:MAG: hypothetical protein HFG26_12490 [Provencibacterium sp.]|jgi:cyclic beta-1,2-glucan synthetase|nr:hypothetical protein [Provencibacterium sp.]
MGGIITKPTGESPSSGELFPELAARKQRGIAHELRGSMRILSKAYQAAQAIPDEEAGVYTWLKDHYYLLEREYKRAVSALRGTRDRSGFGLLCRYFYGAVCRPQRPVDSGTLFEALAAFCEKTEPGYEQLSLCEQALRCALLLRAADAAANPSAPESEPAIRYAVEGMFAAGSIDFSELSRFYSGVERILQQDPAGIYERMDRQSQEEYRALIAQLAHRQGMTETVLARQLLEQASRASSSPQNHIGYPLLHAPGFERSRKRRRAGYLAAVLLAPALLCGAAVRLFGIPAGLLLWFPFYEMTRFLAERAWMCGAPPLLLPRMDIRRVEPENIQTMVAVSLLLEPSGIEKRIADRLEDLYFSNRSEALSFCILADLPAAPYPVTNADEAMLAQARKAVERLNQCYGERFFLFVRARSYQKTQRCYQGWERKRGAIVEFARFIHGEETTACCVAGPVDRLRAARYLIALDSDTQLEFDTAESLIAAAVHPMNRPRYAADGSVEAGYGVLVPRIQPALAGEGSTAFTRVMTGCGGVSGYEVQARDLYSDLFSQAIFTGKGILDMDCFLRTCAGAFPENQVLSHDILEGGRMGCAFLGDVEMVDAEPRSFSAWLARAHRWIRGDWQNLPFLFRTLRLDGKTFPYRCRPAVRFQLFENLRRSLTPPAALLLILLSQLLPQRPAFWVCLLAAGSIGFQPLWNCAGLLIRGGLFPFSRKFFVRAMPQALELCAQGAFLFCTLPSRTFSALDAVFRSLWRTFVSRRRLLEWTTAAQSDRGRIDARHLVRRYWLPELLGIFLLLLSPWPSGRLCGLCFSLLLPLAALTARPSRRRRPALDEAGEAAVRGYAADMLRFFLDYADETRGFLPPDNVQFAPRYAVAERTSPTNIGFMLLSLLAGRDFELISTEELYRRVRGAVDTLQRLEKWHGNLYNWYDLRSLQVLHPAFVSAVDSGNLLGCLIALAQGLAEYTAGEPRMQALIQDIDRLVEETDLSFFYVPVRRLFSIGFDAERSKLSSSHYDYLMSEARLMSYCALALRQVGRRHWGALARTLSRSGGYLGPVSWTGTMFEYYMPQLLLPAYEGSLLDETLAYCLYCQKRRVRRSGLPWGISESGYYAFDSLLNYQYKAHGVQALGVRRGLDEELVLSPYSSFLALPFAPGAALRNLEHLRALGLYAGYGFYEAADFTGKRVSGAAFQPVRSFMAHHVGMSVAACANAVFDGVMQRRFMRNPACRSAAGFLQEKIQKGWVMYDRMDKKAAFRREEKPEPWTEPVERISPASPRAALLANGDISELLTDCGAGYLQYAGIGCTRKEEDLLLGGSGIYCLCACEGEILSASAAPLYQEGPRGVLFKENAVCYWAENGRLHLEMECTLPPAAAVSVKRVRIRLKGQRPAAVKLLFYCEPSLLREQDFNAHVSFARLFLQCGRDRATGGLLFTRRLREGGMGCALLCGFLEGCEFQFEPDKTALLRPPYGLSSLRDFPGRAFSSKGAPNAVCAMQTELRLMPGEEKELHFVLAAGHSADRAREAFIRLREGGKGAWDKAALSPLRDHSAEGSLGLSLLGRIAYLRPLQDSIRQAAARNRLGQRGLWPLSISGDLPLVLLREPETRDPERTLIYARLLAVLRREGFPFDLAALCEGEEACRRLTAELIHAGFEALIRVRAGIFPIDAASISEEQRVLLMAVSAAVAGEKEAEEGASFVPACIRPASPVRLPDGGLPVYGGVFKEGSFYVGRRPRVPYCHILANPTFGTLLSDRSLGYSWSVNARENRITPWSSDAAQDNRGERLFLSLQGRFYDPIDGARVRYASHCAVYEGRCASLWVRAEVTVPARGAQKQLEVLVENVGEEELELELGWYLEPVLAVERHTARMITGGAGERGIFMQNFYNTAVPSAIFMGTDAPSWRHSFERQRILAGDWSEPGSLPHPDPCGMLIVPMRLPPKRREQVRFVLSCASRRESAEQLSARGLFAPGRKADLPSGAVQRPESGGFLRLKTPDKHLDAFFNTLLQNQILASRIYGRTGFYQSSGAYGFRDQLQDAMNYCTLSPAVLRVQLARCCAVQFAEGDVLHWWHALPGGKEAAGSGVNGVRTRYSDDLAWLPLAIAVYLEKTGDKAFLEREIAYLAGDELRPEEHDRYFQPARSGVKESIYRHGLRALERADAPGPRGLIRIGSGDWNDGFSNVGVQGRGESVWLTMFLALCCDRYAGVCRRFGEEEEAQRLRARAGELRAAADRYAWDGEWYARATFDDGTVMGSRQSAECRIDSLPQSFAALCGMPDRDRVRRALDSALRYLVDEETGIIRLFDPPFEKSSPSPGYVQAYPAGIRENGGQYTHAAVWLALSLFAVGRAEEGYRLLRMLGPAHRAAGPGAAAYRLEPYSIAADIYTHPALLGRGGWSLYTGAAGWYWTAVTEGLLGLQRKENILRISPNLPGVWEQAEVEGVLSSTAFSLHIRRGTAEEAKGLTVDGKPAKGIPLDGGRYRAEYVF